MLLRFSRLLAEVTRPDVVLDLLAAVATEDLGADAAIVFRVTTEGNLCVAGSSGIESPKKLSKIENVAIADLPDHVLSALEHCFFHALNFPLICSSNLYGAWVLLSREGREISPKDREMSRALADLAAVSLHRTIEHDKLKKAYGNLRASKEILARSEKLRALGQMSASIAHDLRNLFSSLPLQAMLLRQESENPATVLEVADWIEGMAKHAVATVERLRSFSHQMPPSQELHDSDLEKLIHEALEICKARFGNAIRVKLELKPVPRARLRSSDFVSALVNLFLNAKDAMPSGGTLHVSMSEKEEGALIRVGDSGSGMSPETKSRLFEPFYTTKGHEGTGLGLPMVFAFVQRHGGRICVESELGRGTTFEMWLPFRRTSLAEGASAQ